MRTRIEIRIILHLKLLLKVQNLKVTNRYVIIVNPIMT